MNVKTYVILYKRLTDFCNWKGQYSLWGTNLGWRKNWRSKHAEFHETDLGNMIFCPLLETHKKHTSPSKREVAEMRYLAFYEMSTRNAILRRLRNKGIR